MTEPGKLYWGPLWDFDQSLSDDDFSPEGFNTRPVLWFEQLRQDPAFARALKKRWIDIDEELELVTKKGGMTLKNGTDCTIKWSNDSPKDAGTYTVTVTGKGIYKGSTNASFSIAKASSPFKAKARRVKIKYRKLRKKARTIKRAKAIKLTSAMGKVTYKKVGVSKVRKTRSGKKAVKAGKKTAGKFRINTKTGKITLKKGIKKGTYKLKVKVEDEGNNNYNPQTQTITITVKVQ